MPVIQLGLTRIEMIDGALDTLEDTHTRVLLAVFFFHSVVAIEGIVMAGKKADVIP
jgi:hypothetical protein